MNESLLKMSDELRDMAYSVGCIVCFGRSKNPALAVRIRLLEMANELEAKGS